MLDFRTYTFLKVCKTMNFTRAAEELSITQPAVSQHIRYLEQYYGQELIHIKNKKVTLTLAGEKLFQALSTMVHDEVHLKQTLKETGQHKKVVRLGTTMTIGEFVIAKPLARLVQENPKMQVQMVVENTQELLKRLSDNTIDFAIVEGYFSKGEYDYRCYAREKFIPVCGRDYSLHSEETGMELEELFSQPLIMREQGSGTRELLEKALEERNYSLQDFKNILEINSIHVIKKLLLDHCGISFLYEAAVLEELKSGTLIKIPIREFEVSHDFTFIWKKSSVFGSYYEEMFRLLHGDETGFESR